MCSLSGLGNTYTEFYREGLQMRALGQESSFPQSAFIFTLGLPGLGNTSIH